MTLPLVPFHIAGTASDDIWSYDAGADAWSHVADFVFAGLCHGTVLDNKAYVLSRVDGTSFGVFDPSTMASAALSACPAEHVNGSICADTDTGLIYAIGGTKTGPYDDQLAVHEYDPATDTWTDLIHQAFPAGFGRSLANTAFVPGWGIYYGTGVDKANALPNWVFYRIDLLGTPSIAAFPLFNAWQAVHAPNDWRTKAGLASTPDQLYALGGTDTDGGGTRVVEHYLFPDTDNWESKPDKASYMQTVQSVFDGQALIYSVEQGLNFDRYDPVSGTAPLSSPGTGAGGALVALDFTKVQPDLRVMGRGSHARLPAYRDNWARTRRVKGPSGR